MVGVREDLNLEFNYPLPTHGEQLKPYKTLRDSIYHLKDAPGEYYPGPFDYQYKERQRKRLWDEVSYCIKASQKFVPLHPAGVK